MAIQIIDQFYLNSSVPIDNRFVVGSQSFYTHRDFIEWKYVGMRVWDLNDGLPYVWDGSTYSSENSVSIGGSGTVNKIPKFTTSTTVADSNIYDDGVYVGIGNNSPAYALDVTGVIKSSSNFIGDGSLITNLDADHVTSGTLTLNRLQNSSNANYIMTSGVGGAGQATWVNPTSISVGNATNAVNSVNSTYATNVNIQTTSISGSGYYLLFSTTTGNAPIYTNLTNAVRINPANGNVGIGTGNNALSDKFRVIKSGNSISAAYQEGYTNFVLNTISTGTIIYMRRFVSSVTQSSYWWSRGDGGYSYDEFAFAGRAFLSVNGSGTSNSRALSLQGPGDLDAFRFYFLGNSATVPVIAGYGAYVERNLYVNGTFSAANVRLINSGVDSVTPQFPLSIGAGITRYINTTGLQSGVYQHAATAFDRYVTLALGGAANTTEVRFLCAVEVGEGTGSYQTVERRKGQDGYTAISFLVAAKCRFQIAVDNITGSTLTADCSVSSRRFGFV